MPIEKIAIENFTVFEKFNLEFCRGINVIIGENGVGKTHLIKLLYSFCKTVGAGTYYETIFVSKICNSFFNYSSELQNIKNLRKNGKDINISVEYNKMIYNLSIGEYNSPKENEDVSEMITIMAENRDNSNSVFIPAKEMLTHSNGLLSMAKKYNSNITFDRTLLDVIEKSEQWKLDKIPQIAKNILPKLERIIGGKISIENDSFYVLKESGDKIEFSLEAEGIKKIGVLWQLLMNENITKDTIIFWDEPESNINPSIIPIIVEILLELQKSGVQIFVSTHDYIFAKYFEVKHDNEDLIMFHSLYKTKNNVECESNKNFRDLKNNSIITAFDKLLDEVFDRNLGD
jgi:AAA15 family ATPase/GTPase